MEFNEYQELAKKTDQRDTSNEDLKRLIPLLGLFGEIGSVASEHKKRLRDGQSYKTFEEKFIKELGDVLWYISTLASDMNIDLEKVAKSNLNWTMERWGDLKDSIPQDLYDESFESHEQFPREFHIEFKQDNSNKVSIHYKGKQLGNDLTDNSHEEDGYRFHDIFHFSYMAVLGWSPVLRKLFNKKRKSNPKIDEVEDGARACIIEEAISAMVYENAKDHDFYNDITVIDYELLNTIKGMVRNFETKNITTSLWEKAIIDGYTVFRQLIKNNGGKVYINLNKKIIKYNTEC